MSKPKVLVVDDEPDIITSIQFCLEQEGYDVLTAADAHGNSRTKTLTVEIQTSGDKGE